MNSDAMFTDVSLYPELRSGVGGYLIVPSTSLMGSPENMARSEVAERLVLRRFEDTSSTELEIRTVLWALEEYQKEKGPGLGNLRIYTDSQCLAGLLKRRPGLVDKAFISKRTNRPLKNAALYCRFYQFYDELGFEIIKVAGHTPSRSQDPVHRIFSWVDREVRKALIHV
ncbi:MAG: RNase H family protein [Thermodesulfobacteriota bacterium]